MKLEEFFDSDKLKKQRLRKMKLLAGSFLAVAFLVYVMCLIFEKTLDDVPGWLGYVKASSEAGMVGGLADWFAVTALFRYPLGLPIPHTAIIPKKKDQLGETLADFVKDNFLTVEAVSKKVENANIPFQIGEWLKNEKNADKVAIEAIKAIKNILKTIEEKDLAEGVNSLLEDKAKAEVWSPRIGEFLTTTLENGDHKALVQLLVDNIYDWVLKSESKLSDMLGGEAPSWAPQIVKDLIFGKIYAELIDFVTNIKNDENHQARAALDNYLMTQTKSMQDDEKVINKLDSWQNNMIEKGNVSKLATTIWEMIRDSLENQFADNDSRLSILVREKIGNFGSELTKDSKLQESTTKLIVGSVSYLVDNYATQFLTVITDTINSWDGKEAANKLELNVGRDLQFIRINGTIVGSLVGLLIYTFTQIFF